MARHHATDTIGTGPTALRPALSPWLAVGAATEGGGAREEQPLKQASTQVARAECQYCQAAQPRLYRLPLIRPMGELTDLVVCVFCYLRLAGLKPRPAALVAAGEPELA